MNCWEFTHFLTMKKSICGMKMKERYQSKAHKNINPWLNKEIKSRIDSFIFFCFLFSYFGVNEQRIHKHISCNTCSCNRVDRTMASWYQERKHEKKTTRLITKHKSSSAAWTKWNKKKNQKNIIPLWNWPSAICRQHLRESIPEYE